MSSPGLLTHNIQSGAIEAYLHGLYASLLKSTDYHTLAQCESVSDVKQYLSAQTAFKDVVSSPPGAKDEIQNSARILHQGLEQAFTNEFLAIYEEACPELRAFLDFVSAHYMLRNLLKVLLHGRNTGGAEKTTTARQELLQQCHPLGRFPGLSLLTESETLTLEEMFEIVLRDSPVGRFFHDTTVHDLRECSVEYLYYALLRSWTEQFATYCATQGGATAEVMEEILFFEADQNVILLTLSAMAHPSALPAEERRKLFPCLGHLLPLHESIASVRTEGELRNVLQPFPEYAVLLGNTDLAEFSRRPRDGKSQNDFGLSPLSATSLQARVEQQLRVQLAALHHRSFARQFHYGSFYSYLRLKEMELGNLQWVLECVAHGMQHRIPDLIA